MEIHSSETQISEGVYRLTIAPNNHFEFSQFLLTDEKTCLVHSGKEKLFAPLLQMVKTKLNGRDIDYIVFSHVEADETGAINNWLAEYPNAQVVCNKVANINLEDFLLKPAKILKDGETFSLGSKTMQLIETPHFPHNWDAHMWFETSEQILFSSDFCCQGGITAPIVETDISETIIDFYAKGGFIPYGNSTIDALDKLSDYEFRAIAPMHGSVITGNVCASVFEKVQADLARRSVTVNI